MSVVRFFVLGVLATVTGVFCNLVAAIFEDTFKRLTPLQIGWMLIGIIVIYSIEHLILRPRNKVNLEDIKATKSEINRLRQELYRIQSRGESGDLITSEDINSWTNYQNQIATLKRKLIEEFSDESFGNDPIDNKLPPKIGCWVRLMNLVKYSTTIFGIILSIGIVFILSSFISLSLHDEAAALIDDWRETRVVNAIPTPSMTIIGMIEDTPLVSQPTATPTMRIAYLMTPSSIAMATLTPTSSTTLEIEGLIAFNSNRSGNNDIYAIDTQTREILQLTSGAADERVASWSPDGTQIAFQSNADGDYEIYILSLISGERWQITTNECNDFAPSWSPNGDKFTFYSDCDGNREIYAMDINGKNRVQLTNSTKAIYNWFPSWSPDGGRITYSSNLEGEYMIYVMDADGTNSKALHPGCISFFSPDGRSIVFATYCTDLGEIWIMNRDGSNAQIITEYDGNTNPSWSPDGEKIVFQSDLSGNEDIWMMDLDGSNWIQITNHPARDSAPIWQPYQSDVSKENR